jgi:outer membrane protein OmpA-like peptidoglycan-associated protein
MIRKFLIGLTAFAFVAGCTTFDPVTGERTPNRTVNAAIIGALGGAALGTLAGGDDRRNAAIGAGIGALAGAGIGAYMDNQEETLRERLRNSGVTVTRVNDQQILLNFPAALTFEFNRADISPGFVPTLQQVSGVLRDYPQTTIDVFGHTDSVGSDAYNMDLSRQRAQTVAGIFANSGIQQARLYTTPFGESRPIADNATDFGRAQNRRVEVFISALCQPGTQGCPAR